MYIETMLKKKQVGINHGRGGNKKIEDKEERCSVEKQLKNKRRLLSSRDTQITSVDLTD